MWALVLEDQKCPATSLNYVIIFAPPSFPQAKDRAFPVQAPQKTR